MDVMDLPSETRDETIREMREFSRRLVRELGFMRTSLAGSDLAPSAVHAIVEIGMQPGIQARDLAAILRLDKSNTSRQLAKLAASGLLNRGTDENDARSARLSLTAEGEALRCRIDRFATEQVSHAMRRLLPHDQRSIVRALAMYADALGVDNANLKHSTVVVAADRIVEGYVPGCIGDVVSLHARYYSQISGFGIFFEKKVATELGMFVESLPAPSKAIWLYVEQGKTLASIAIDGDATTRVAHLRWFIVDDALRGAGVGRELLSRAMTYVDARFDETYLWTFNGLDAARHLYESFGFSLVQESAGRQWGATVIEQRFNRRAPC
ncbi:bifunctional helix-turn-helix transcriptional regulator/GNAT family N-acetyltransferase [Alcaligenaceae bacterium C4P045]|nr:bifunctional helix-turn-helix transcriptional regulator/GNAT family N-acetyltransferase [Alcaligenaceae bacterium C4P045]